MIEVELCKGTLYGCNSCDKKGYVDVRLQQATASGGIVITLCQECAIKLGTTLYHL